jgi:DNA repair protein RadA/Sms
LPKQKIIFNCTECGAGHPKWIGQCQECNAWNSLVEEILAEPQKGEARFVGFAPKEGIKRLDSLSIEDFNRYSCGVTELDRVLGGGMVPGSVILLGGDPGIGKSTLLLQCMTSISESLTTLNVTG